jgi:hypothetical protein
MVQEGVGKNINRRKFFKKLLGYLAKIKLAKSCCGLSPVWL